MCLAAVRELCRIMQSSLYWEDDLWSLLPTALEVSPAPQGCPPHWDRDGFSLSPSLPSFSCHKAVRNGPKLCSTGQVPAELRGGMKLLNHQAIIILLWAAIWNITWKKWMLSRMFGTPGGFPSLRWIMSEIINHSFQVQKAKSISSHC